MIAHSDQPVGITERLNPFFTECNIPSIINRQLCIRKNTAMHLESLNRSKHLVN